MFKNDSKCINIPMIGFGTWQIPSKEAGDLVSKAITVGYRHIDCAHGYSNEESIGNTLGLYKDRKNIFVTSKLWGDSHEPQKVEPSFRKTLENLKLDYLDLYLIHQPARVTQNCTSLWYKKEWLIETWREMVKLTEKGHCKFVGVCNFTTKKLNWLMEEGDTPSCNQVELHPYLPQNKLLQFCNENKIALTAYSPIGTPATPINLPSRTSKDNPVLLKDETILEVAKKNSITPAQVLLSWGIHRKTPVLIKSSSEQRMIENLKATDITLPNEDIEVIDKIPIKCRYLNCKFFCPENHTVEEYWDNEYYN